MISEDQIREFIDDHVVTMFGDVKKSDDKWRMFVLSYYDTYTLLALTKMNVIFLDEEVMQAIISHKNGLFFRIIYEPNFRTFELKTIIFSLPFTRCIKVVNQVKQVLAKHNVGSHIDTMGKNKKTYTNVDIVKIPQ